MVSFYKQFSQTREIRGVHAYYEKTKINSQITSFSSQYILYLSLHLKDVNFSHIQHDQKK